MLNKICIGETIGHYCITFNQADKLYKTLLPLLKNNKQIELDFSKVETCSAMFFNFGISKLYKRFNHNKISELLKIVNINKIQLDCLNISMKTSRKYFTDDNYKKAVNEVMGEYYRIC